MMSNTVLLIVLPLLFGICLFPGRNQGITVKSVLAVIISILSLVSALLTFRFGNVQAIPAFTLAENAETGLISNVISNIQSLSWLRIDNLSSFIVTAISFFAVLAAFYSLPLKTKTKPSIHFYPYLLITLGAANGAVLCDHLLLFVFFWGILGISLYKLIRGSDDESAAAAKKSLILIGASDSLMILGIAVCWNINSSLSISGTHLPTDSFLSVLAFLCLLVGSFTKAGAFPFHTWIPDFTAKAPAVSSAYLPASLDKLLGIYFMSRLCLQMFVLNQWLVLILLLTGSFTIIIGVMMALVQHNFKKLLGYHSISQVGYMILGLGIGSPIAIAGGLFHMLNNSLYKSGLFFVAGNVETATGKNELEELGGLSKALPYTFFSAMIFSLSISGVPPLNGFASKWLIYQGIIDFGNGSGIGSRFWIVWLGLAVIGSALTLASFIKFMSGIFLGRASLVHSKVKEPAANKWLPAVILAVACIGTGVFASNLVIPRLIMPLFGSFDYPGIWNSSTVGILFVISIGLGCLFYLAGNINKFRTDDSFIGGETNREERQVRVLDFYATISHARILSGFYRLAERKVFDIYHLLKELTFGISHVLSKCHTGILPLYAVWMIAGLVLLMIILL
jgi:formate hydrogenlyase subunit 3/multisubunit Na+/H+ antiporter MnhD subunit